MRSMAALEAKNRFGELLTAAQREPVSIEKHGKAVAVMISAEDYKALEAARLTQLKAEIARGMEDIREGRVVDGKSAFEAIKAEFKPA